MTRYDIAWCYLKNPFNLMCYAAVYVIKNVKPIEVEGSLKIAQYFFDSASILIPYV